MKTLDELDKMYDFVCDPDDNGIMVVKLGSKKFHVDADGVPLYEERFNWVNKFDKEGIAIAHLGHEPNVKHFHIGKDGKALYEERFDWVGPFCKGIATVTLNDEVFQITKDGKRYNNKEGRRYA